MAVQPVQEHPFPDGDAVVNCAGDGRHGKGARTLPESADDCGCKINEGEKGGQQQKKMEAREEEPLAQVLWSAARAAAGEVQPRRVPASRREQ